MPDSVTRQWIKTAADEKAATEGCYFDEAAGLYVVEFFHKFLCHSKGEWAGQPFELLPYQRDDIILPLFSWKRPDGTRRFRKAFISTARKSGKSTLAAGVGLAMLVADAEPGAEIYSAACDREQSSIVHGEAVRMVDASPELRSILDVNRSTKRIVFPATNSFYRALSGEKTGKHGLNSHCIIFDELHEWRGRELWSALETSFGARRQGLLFIITTAGTDEHSICWHEYDYAKGILTGTNTDDRTFAYIREPAPGDDWQARETWHKANPALGIIIQEDEFAREAEEAKKRPDKEAEFKQLRLNTWQTVATPAIRPQDWAACEQTYSESDLIGLDCYGGLDLSKSRDMTAFVLVFPDAEGFKLLPYFWLPEDVILDHDSPEEYRIWAKAKYIEGTPGNVCDYNFIEQRIAELNKRFNIRSFSYDPWNAEATTQRLSELHGIERVAFAQNHRNYAEPTAEFERLILSRQLAHNGHPILTWQASHVVFKSDASGNRRPVKPQSHNRRKVDGIVASIMALGQAMAETGKRRLLTESPFVFA